MQSSNLGLWTIQCLYLFQYAHNIHYRTFIYNKENKMPRYHIKDFLKSQNILILEKIQEREQNPFTMSHGKRFFDNFLHFELNNH